MWDFSAHPLTKVQRDEVTLLHFCTLALTLLLLKVVVAIELAALALPTVREVRGGFAITEVTPAPASCFSFDFPWLLLFDCYHGSLKVLRMMANSNITSISPTASVNPGVVAHFEFTKEDVHKTAQGGDREAVWSSLSRLREVSGEACAPFAAEVMHVLDHGG